MSEAFTPQLSLERKRSRLLPRRRAARLRAEIAGQEGELLRGRQTALRLAADLASLRTALAAVTTERDSLAAELRRLSEERDLEADRAAQLLDAVADQQVAVAELERAVVAALSALEA